jgi:hypothetical protein
MQKIMECLVFLVVACCLAMRTQLGSQIYMSQELLNMTLLLRHEIKLQSSQMGKEGHNGQRRREPART